jgi:hypothetical protein
MTLPVINVTRYFPRCSPYYTPPTHHTTHKGGYWHLIIPSEIDYTFAHSVKYADGSIWDTINGWRACIHGTPAEKDCQDCVDSLLRKPEMVNPVPPPPSSPLVAADADSDFLRKVLEDHAEGRELKSTSDLKKLREILRRL